MNLWHRTKRLSHCHGFTMLEAMIALLIFSVGLLGLAGLQAGALQNNRTANLRSVAVIAAHDMAERIRANDRGSSSQYNSISAGIPGSYTDCSPSATPCDSNQLASWDAYQWETSLANQLPAGRGTVSRTGPGNPFTIIVMWDEANTGATGTSCSGNPNTDLKCYKMDFMP